MLFLFQYFWAVARALIYAIFNIYGLNFQAEYIGSNLQTEPKQVCGKALTTSG